MDLAPFTAVVPRSGIAATFYQGVCSSPTTIVWTLRVLWLFDATAHTVGRRATPTSRTFRTCRTRWMVVVAISTARFPSTCTAGKFPRDDVGTTGHPCTPNQHLILVRCRCHFLRGLHTGLAATRTFSIHTTPPTPTLVTPVVLPARYTTLVHYLRTPAALPRRDLPYTLWRCGHTPLTPQPPLRTPPPFTLCGGHLRLYHGLTGRPELV